MTAALDNPIARRDVFRGAAALAAVAAIGGADAAIAQAPSGARTPHAGSRLDADGMQILFADLQVPLVARSKTMTPVGLGRSAGVLAKIAMVLGMPSFFSVVPEGSGVPHLIPELLPFASARNTLLRTLVSPFQHPPTVAALARNNRRTLVIAGYAAEAVVIQATLDAIAAGYTVFYVVDAIGALTARTEAAAFRDMDAAGAFPTSVLSLATRLVHDFISSPGKETMAALQPLLSE